VAGPRSTDPTVSSSAADSVAGEVQDAPRSASWLFTPGQLLAERYRVCAFIARGGMGEVYDAYDEKLGVAIALKALLPGKDPIASEARLAREVVLARRVTHPGVCRVFDVAHERVLGGTVPFVTMELLRGSTLAQHLTGAGPLPLVGVLGFVEQLAAALDAAHAAGVVHRDLKPGNVIIAAGHPARVVITDFGLARAVTPVRGARVATTHHFVGTPAYMAPEQVLEKPATTATDIYALGLILFEMVTGTRPFEGPSTLALAMDRLRAPAPRASSRRRGLDPRWDLAIARCLSRDPANRFKRAGDLVAALRGDVRLVPVALPEPRRPARRTSPRRRTIALACAAAAFLGAMTVGAALAPEDAAQVRKPAPPPQPVPDVTAPMRPFFASANDVEVRSLAVTPGGDIFVAGHALGTVTFGGKSAWIPRGTKRGFVARIDRFWRVRWMRAIGGSGESTADSVALMGDQLIVTGTQRGGVRMSRLALGRDTAGCFVVAMSLTHGQPRWLDACARHDAAETAVVADTGAVYVASAGTYRRSPQHAVEGRLAVVAYGRDGKRRWSKESETKGKVSRPRLAVREQTLAVAATVLGRMLLDSRMVGSDGRPYLIVSSFDPVTGTVRWANTLGDAYGRNHAVGVVAREDGRVTVLGAFDEFRLGSYPHIGSLSFRGDGTSDEPHDAHHVIAAGRDAWAPLASEGDQWTLAGVVTHGFEIPRGGYRAHRGYPQLIVMRSSLVGSRDVSHVVFGEGSDVIIHGVARAGRRVLVGGTYKKKPSAGGNDSMDAPVATGFLLEVDGWDR
jgi:hypothetical protein